MPDRKTILVTYDSGYGSTAEVAGQIEKSLCEADLLVDLQPVDNIKNLEQYSAVIIGSPIRYDRWMPAAKSFVLNHQQQLSKIPVAYFFCCMTLARRTAETEQKAQHYAEMLANLAPQVNPISIGQFSGVLDLTKMSLPLHLLFMIFSKISGIKPGDYRNWKEIRKWAKAIAEHL